MAIVQYSGLITQIRGKLGGSVLSKYSGGFSMYPKPQPRKFGSVSQQQVRNYFQAFAGTWRSLTNEQRADWNYVALNTPLYNRIGELRPISGYAYFIKFNQFLRDAGLGIVRNVATDLAPPYGLQLETSNFDVMPAQMGFIITNLDVKLTTISNSADANMAILYASLPSPYSDFKYHKSWYRVALLPIGANIGESEEVNFNLTDVVMPEGWRMFDGSFTLFRVECVNLESAQFSAGAVEYDEVVVTPEILPTAQFIADPSLPGRFTFTSDANNEAFISLLFDSEEFDPDNFDFIMEVGNPVPTDVDPLITSWWPLTNGRFWELTENENVAVRIHPLLENWAGQIVFRTGLNSFPGDGWFFPIRSKVRSKATGNLGLSSVGFMPIFEDSPVPPDFPFFECPDPVGECLVARESASICFWGVYWIQTNSSPSPTDFQLEISANFSASGSVDIPGLSFSIVGLYSIAASGGPPIFQITPSLGPYETGDELLSAFGGSFPIPAAGNSCYIRLRSYDPVSATYSSPTFQEFEYVQY